jgi:dipeptidyl-peptidase 4
MGRFVLFAFFVFSLSAHAAELTLESIYLGSELNPNTSSALYWMPDGKTAVLLGFDGDGNVELSHWNPANQKSTPLASASDLKLSAGDEAPVAFSHIQIPANARFLLLSETIASRGLKTGGHAYLYDLKTKKLSEAAPEYPKKHTLQLSPDGSKLGFVSENDLYVLDLGSRSIDRLTYTGSETILNGTFDWVYEEEFGVINGWIWSPDSEHIAFWQIDQSKVPSYPLLNYEEAHPTVHWMRYPKAGDPNPSARVGISSVKTKASRWVDVGFQPEHYIPRVSWLSAEDLAVQVLNRDQNTLQFFRVKARTPESRLLFTEKQTTWIDPPDKLFPLPKRKGFLWSSEESGFNHLYLVEEKGRRALTQGSWEVLELLGTDGKEAFFLANRDSLFETHLYAVDLKSRALRRISKEPGTHSAEWSPGFHYYLDYFHDSVTPHSSRLHKRDGSVVRNFTELPEAFLKLKLASTETFEMTTSEGVKLFGRMVKPADFDPSKRYPVLLSVYGGPGSRKAIDGWDGLWTQYLAKRGIVVVTVDNRGTGGRGKNFKSQTYLDLGRRESDDQIEVAKYFQKKPWVDAGKIGMWGWSYGGYLTALTVEKGGSLFAAGIAVAPVSHWKYYDSIYTERFMSTPEKNPKGYEQSSPLTHAASLTAPLLVVHGTGDDNVHYQNSLGLVNALIAANKEVDTLIYPYRTHGISEGQYTRYHLYKRLTQFLLRHLKGELSWEAPSPLDELRIPAGFDQN